MHKKACAALLLILPALLRAMPATESSSVTSTNADYDGNTLLLKGNVKLDHGLGQMTAEEAALQRQETGKDFPFSLIHLRKDVVLHLKNEGELTCDGADLDFISMKGNLAAIEDHQITYTIPLKKMGEKLRMTSRTAMLDIAKQQHEGKKSQFEIQSILAKESVKIEYGNIFTLIADKALYRKQLLANKQVQEIITAAPANAESKCRLIHESDVIDADSVDLDLLEGKLSLYKPKGVLASAFVQNSPQGLHFLSHHLLWDHAKNMLTLKGDVQIVDTSLGSIFTEELKLTQTVSKGKRVLQGIQTKSKASLQYQDPATGHTHKLLCHGPLKLDRSQLFATLESPVVDGETPEEKQIYYESQEFACFSNKAAIEYSLEGNKLAPASLQLFGNIRLLSRGSDKPTRRGIADRMSYLPTTKTLILAANPGKRVLFWDEEQSLRVTAPEIHITRDVATGKDQIKGVGQVQFTLTAEEHDMLSKLIPHHD